MNKIRWNEQNPPVSTEAITAVGCTWYGAHILDKQGIEIGLFEDAKWAQTRNGPALCIGSKIIGWLHTDRIADDIPVAPVTGPVNMPDMPDMPERTPWVPGRYRKPAVDPTPLDMVREEYHPCVWDGCDSGRCVVKQTEHARGFPVLFYVQCPECGAHGPECWERSEAVKKWKSGSDVTEALKLARLTIEGNMAAWEYAYEGQEPMLELMKQVNKWMLEIEKRGGK